MKYDIGFLGGGQLARMSIQAAQHMGLECISLDPSEKTPASAIAPSIQGELSDPKKLAQILLQCERVTLENEFIPADAIKSAIGQTGFPEHRLIPGTIVLETVQDKLVQKNALKNSGVPSPKSAPISADGSNVEGEIGFPCVLKARFGGYDGKGTRYARTQEEFESHRPLWSSGGWMAEEFVDFSRELAQIVHIVAQGAGAFPTMESVQSNHVCDLVFPCDRDATEIAISAAKAMGGIGLFGVEMFETQSGEILINEIAPRPHNSGHYTLDWGGVSQFEQHIRIVMRLPPLEPNGGDCCMANLLGQEEVGDWKQAMRAAMADPGVRFHWYGKVESRPGRKMGHINVAGADCIGRAKAARHGFYDAWTNQG